MMNKKRAGALARAIVSTFILGSAQMAMAQPGGGGGGGSMMGGSTNQYGVLEILGLVNRCRCSNHTSGSRGQSVQEMRKKPQDSH